MTQPIRETICDRCGVKNDQHECDHCYNKSGDEGHLCVECYREMEEAEKPKGAQPSTMDVLRSRLDDAEAVLKGIGCPGCEGSGYYGSGITCQSCKGSGLHPDATLFFERWK